jgi:uncharacterized protein (UPF0248 family)
MGGRDGFEVGGMHRGRVPSHGNRRGRLEEVQELRRYIMDGQYIPVYNSISIEFM